MPPTPLTTPGVQGTEGPPAAPAGTKMADLLTPTKDDPKDPYVHFGNVAVERGLKDDWVKAQSYLGKSNEAVNSLYDLEHGKKELKVDKINDGNDRYNPHDNKIYWDPNSAMVNADGSKQTAANGLLHEQGHATEFKNHEDRYLKQRTEANMRYNNAEEQRNITWETKYSKELGEGTRQDHGGTPFNAKGPTSLDPVDHALTDPAQLRAAINGERGGMTNHGYNAPPEPGAGADAIVKWDGKPHSGPVVHVDGSTVAQYVADNKGGGQYQVYDVAKDLGGKMPPENQPRLSIDAHGNFGAKAVEHDAAVGVGGR